MALLSTNLLGSFDDAFLRRLQYVVRFPLPDAALREELWRRAIPEGRRGGGLPFAALAQVELSPAALLELVGGTTADIIAEGGGSAPY